MPEGDIDPRLILAVLLGAAAVALAFFGFLHWRRRAAGRPRPARGASSRPRNWEPRSESLDEVAKASDQISSSTDASPSAQPALIESWRALGVGAKLAAIWLVLFTLLWLAFGIFSVALLFSFIGLGLSHVLVGPGRHWANLLLFAPLLVAGAATEVFEPQDWRAFGLMLFLIPTHVGIWIGRTARGGLRGRQHKVALIFLGLLLMLFVAIVGELLPDCPLWGLLGC